MRRRQRRVVVRFSDNGPLTFLRQLDVVADAANVARTRFVGPRISEVRGKIGNLRAQLDFWQQNRRSWKGKTEAGRPISVFTPHFRFLSLWQGVSTHIIGKIMGRTANFVSILKRRQGRNCSCRRWHACLCCFRLAQRPVLDPYASVGSTPSSLRTSSKAAAMALSMS